MLETSEDNKKRLTNRRKRDLNKVRGEKRSTKGTMFKTWACTGRVFNLGSGEGESHEKKRGRKKALNSGLRLLRRNMPTVGNKGRGKGAASWKYSRKWKQGAWGLQP